MSLGKIRFNTMVFSPEIIMIEPVEEGSNEFGIYFYLNGSNESFFEMEIGDLELTAKIFNTIWDRLVCDGYCEVDRFDERGNYKGYGFVH